MERELKRVIASLEADECQALDEAFKKQVVEIFKDSSLDAAGRIERIKLLSKEFGVTRDVLRDAVDQGTDFLEYNLFKPYPQASAAEIRQLKEDLRAYERAGFGSNHSLSDKFNHSLSLIKIVEKLAAKHRVRLNDA